MLYTASLLVVFVLIKGFPAIKGNFRSGFHLKVASGLRTRHIQVYCTNPNIGVHRWIFFDYTQPIVIHQIGLKHRTYVFRQIRYIYLAFTRNYVSLHRTDHIFIPEYSRIDTISTHLTSTIFLSPLNFECTLHYEMAVERSSCLVGFRGFAADCLYLFVFQTVTFVFSHSVVVE